MLIQTKVPSMELLPERLQLFHKGRRVKVECMFVEVKSSNDRLDARQEDWLNVLDRHGRARVCKFEDNIKTKKLETAKVSLASAGSKTEAIAF
jgi:hypothetical protein